MITRISRYFLILFLIYSAVPASAFDMPIPHGSKATWVASDIKQNGLPMQIMKLKSSLAVESVLDFYRQEWKSHQDELPGYVEHDIGAWKVISHFQGTQNFIVQVKSTGVNASEGFLSVVEMTAVSEVGHRSMNFPSLSGSEQISTTDSYDQDKFATTIILQNQFSVGSNRQFYQTKMSSQGWHLVHRGNYERTELMIFNRRDASLEIAISATGSGLTAIFANFISDES